MVVTRQYVHLALIPEGRLDILRAADTFRKWYSLDDKPVCVVCDRLFTGRQTEIQWDRRGRYLLKCPTSGCPSFAARWFFVNNAVAAGRMFCAAIQRQDKTSSSHPPNSPCYESGGCQKSFFNRTANRGDKDARVARIGSADIISKVTAYGGPLFSSIA